MAFCGGTFGIYAIVSRMGNFGQAQTANLIRLTEAILGKNVGEGLLRLGALVVFVAGIALATLLERRENFPLKLWAIMIDAAAVLTVGFFPADMNPVAALYPFFFATAFQWCVFKGVGGHAASTIFSTNNLRQFTTALIDVIMAPKESLLWKEKRIKLKFFGGTLLYFHSGILLGYLAWMGAGFHSIWFTLIPLTAACGLVVVHEPVALVEGLRLRMIEKS